MRGVDHAHEQGALQPLVATGATLTFDETVVADESHGKARYLGAFHWRGRIATTNPLFPHTAWFSAAGNAVTETKLRNVAAPAC